MARTLPRPIACRPPPAYDVIMLKAVPFTLAAWLCLMVSVAARAQDAVDPAIEADQNYTVAPGTGNGTIGILLAVVFVVLVVSVNLMSPRRGHRD